MVRPNLSRRQPIPRTTGSMGSMPWLAISLGSRCAGPAARCIVTGRRPYRRMAMSIFSQHPLNHFDSCFLILRRASALVSMPHDPSQLAFRKATVQPPNEQTVHVNADDLRPQLPGSSIARTWTA
jgi:hypothetical protein